MSDYYTDPSDTVGGHSIYLLLFFYFFASLLSGAFYSSVFHFVCDKPIRALLLLLVNDLLKLKKSMLPTKHKYVVIITTSSSKLFLGVHGTHLWTSFAHVYLSAAAQCAS